MKGCTVLFNNTIKTSAIIHFIFCFSLISYSSISRAAENKQKSSPVTPINLNVRILKLHWEFEDVREKIETLTSSATLNELNVLQKKLERISNTLSWMQVRKDQTSLSLRKTVESNFKKELNADPTKAYEYLGLDAHKRYTYTTDDIISSSNVMLHKTNDEIAKFRIRQSRWLFGCAPQGGDTMSGDEVAKEDYDAYLSMCEADQKKLPFDLDKHLQIPSRNCCLFLEGLQGKITQAIMDVTELQGKLQVHAPVVKKEAKKRGSGLIFVCPIFRKLSKTPVDPDKLLRDQAVALHSSFDNNDQAKVTKILTSLLHAKVSPNAKIDINLSRNYSILGVPLFWYAQSTAKNSKDVANLTMMLNHKADFNVYVDQFMFCSNVSLLYFASKAPELSHLTEFLLKHGAHPNMHAGFDQDYPLALAVDQSGNEKNVQLLLKYKADPNAWLGKFPISITRENMPIIASILSSSISYKNIFEYIDLLVKAKADINQKDSNGNPLLCYAKSAEILKFLVDQKAEINGHDGSGYPLLGYVVDAAIPDSSIYRQESGLIEMLIDAKADVNCKSKSGTPLLANYITDTSKYKDVEPTQLAKRARLLPNMRLRPLNLFMGM